VEFEINLWDGSGGTWCSDGSKETCVKAAEDFQDVLVGIAAV
jgi:hypothetical protein